MPKAHFDCGAVIQAALDTPLGIAISTNHPQGFRRLLYKHMREHPESKVSILQNPNAPNGFLLVPEAKYEEALANAQQ